MPIYEFHCGKCERDSEILTRSSRWQGTKCPHCGSTRLEKKLSTFSSKSTGSSPDCGTVCPTGPSPGGCGGCPCKGGRHRH